MSTPPKYPPTSAPIANQSDGFNIDRTWLAFLNGLAAQAAAAGPGNVTHTGTLTAEHLLLGNGAADIKALAATGTSTTVLHGATSGPPVFAPVVEADQQLIDVTTANVTTTAHGYTPKLPNDVTKFLNGIGTYTVPPGSGGTVTSVTATPPLTSSGGTTPNIALTNTAVTPATYGDSTHVGQFTVDAEGRLTFAANVAISGGGGGSWIPLVTGSEPPVFVTDGAGHLILVAYP